jgi:hypothetical protein
MRTRSRSPIASNPSPAQPGVPPDLTCPEVSIRSGASTYAVGLPGKPAAGADLRYQVSITRTARECQLNAGVISVKIGVQGRVIAGPAQAPTTVDIPMRMAVVFETVGQSRTIATKAFRTQVAMTPDGTVPFTLIMEDIAYPVPPGAEGDYYTFYIGFDPQALTPERPAAKKKK